MASRKTIIIKESSDELRKLLKTVKNFHLQKRINCLIFLKENKFKYRNDLAKDLCVGYSSLKRWLITYEEGGVELLLSYKEGCGSKCQIPKNIQEALTEKIHNSNEPFMGYRDAMFWVQENFQYKVGYQSLRAFLITNFGSKLKSPRKSHYKKDPLAIEAFKKTTGINRII